MDKPEHSDNTEKNTKNDRSIWIMLGTVSAIGIEFAACTIAGFYLGTWLGSHLGNRQVWVLVGVLAGMVVGVAGAVGVIRRIMRESDE
ncbi:hypothetical protein DCC85_20335 [Paenibacillus sp. CAA11]|uniref:AtpZ/AtpI family protein n=1 Tax=Paenibacillus sp. CAA11 TaxID=1532905 RepID=UPI000D3D8970|nr:AtpZ/AtpI family protein [Paenibacillus sp. CAA11]AWB46280.1 hypothetical protein DCC85_20335 [Paenibacillus sp. CAA11]